MKSNPEWLEQNAGRVADFLVRVPLELQKLKDSGKPLAMAIYDANQTVKAYFSGY